MVDTRENGKNAGRGGRNKKYNNNEPYFCDREKFLAIYELERRRAERKWHSSFLVLLKIVSRTKETAADKENEPAEKAGAGAKSLAEIEQTYQQNRQVEVPDDFTAWLEEILTRGIRQGDAICRWSDEQYTIILHDIKEEDVAKVIKRIKTAYKNKLSGCPHQDCWYNIGGKCKSRNLKQETKSFCSQLSYMKKKELIWSYYQVQP